MSMLIAKIGYEQKTYFPCLLYTPQSIASILHPFPLDWLDVLLKPGFPVHPLNYYCGVQLNSKDIDSDPQPPTTKVGIKGFLWLVIMASSGWYLGILVVGIKGF